jgi:branched-chain amino acid aminotransferase
MNHLSEKVVANGIDIPVSLTPNSRLPQVDMNDIPFGKIFSDHMLVARFTDGKWEQPEIVPYGEIGFTPAMSALNYGQSIFEGMKAYKNTEGETTLFRPRDNFRRFARSAHRMCMPEVPEDIFLGGLHKLLQVDKDWIPPMETGGALYIRPLLFAVDNYIGVKASDDYMFVIFTCPVGAYYTKPVNLLATKEFVRAAIGGTGSAKAAGNYAAAMLPDKIARSQGYNNMLWLDGNNHLYIEECGTMNIFFVIGKSVLTPRLTGTILPGVTRKSVIRLVNDELVKKQGYTMEVRRISIHEIEEAYEEGLLYEAFGTGTAASIAPINKISFAGKDMVFPPAPEQKVSKWLSDTLSGIKYGTIADPYGWTEKIV